MIAGDYYQYEGREIYFRIVRKLREASSDLDYNWLYCTINLENMECSKDVRNQNFFTRNLKKVYDHNKIAKLEQIYLERGRMSQQLMSGGTFVINSSSPNPY